MSFQQGLSGLNAASKNLDVIGNNVANTNTVGFKQSQTQFADMFANSLSGGGGIQAGIGVKVTDVAQQFGQGSITVSNNPLDIAVNGAGFYRLSDQGAVSYSRNGQFHPDKDGYIVNSNGLRLTGYSANATGQINSGAPTDLRISTADLAPSTTTLVNGLVNLDSREAALSSAAFDPTDPATYHSSTSAPIYDSLGNETTLSTYFVKTAANSWDLFAVNNGAVLNGGRVEGILVFHLRYQQLEKPVLYVVSSGFGRAFRAVGRKRVYSGCILDGTHGRFPYCPIVKVFSSKVFAVFIMSTLFWYEREAEIISTISSTTFTFGMVTNPSGLAMGWVGSYTIFIGD